MKSHNKVELKIDKIMANLYKSRESVEGYDSNWSRNHNGASVRDYKETAEKLKALFDQPITEKEAGLHDGKWRIDKESWAYSKPPADIPAKDKKLSKDYLDGYSKGFDDCANVKDEPPSPQPQVCKHESRVTQTGTGGYLNIWCKDCGLPLETPSPETKPKIENVGFSLNGYEAENFIKVEKKINEIINVVNSLVAKEKA